jgi:uncharacterized protein YkwD
MARAFLVLWTAGLLACARVVSQAPPAPLVERDALPGVPRLEESSVRAVNEVRRQAGLSVLVASPELVAVARAHSADQAHAGRSGHLGTDGRGPAERARDRGIRYSALAENVAMNRGYDDPVRAAMAAWMASPAHRKNILDPRFETTGVGVAIAENGAVYFTQLFLDPPD